MAKTLDRLAPDEDAVIKQVHLTGAKRGRLQELGFIAGAQVRCVHISPFGDPVAYEILDTVIALRRSDAQYIELAET